MECGENQWIADIRRQAQRLTRLTNDLIYLSRMEEESPRLQPIEFPLSDVAEEMAQSFQALAKSQGKELLLQIQPMLSFTGDEKAIRQLLSILLDNALKYSADSAPLKLGLENRAARSYSRCPTPSPNPWNRTSCPTCSTAFTGPINPAAAKRAVTAWGCPSPEASCSPTREKSGRKAPMAGR